MSTENRFEGMVVHWNGTYGFIENKGKGPRKIHFILADLRAAGRKDVQRRSRVTGTYYHYQKGPRVDQILSISPPDIIEMKRAIVQTRGAAGYCFVRFPGDRKDVVVPRWVLAEAQLRLMPGEEVLAHKARDHKGEFVDEIARAKT